jgi:hypothetical protein
MLYMWRDYADRSIRIYSNSCHWTNYLFQNSSGGGRDIWFVVGAPLHISSGAGMVTWREAAVPLQKRLGPGRFIWLVAAVVGGLVGAVSARVVVCDRAAARSSGDRRPLLMRYWPIAGVPPCVSWDVCPVTGAGAITSSGV